jgi:transketolase
MLNKKLFLSNKIFSKDVDMEATREGWGKALLYLGEKDPNVFVLCADLTDSTKCNYFKNKFPQRFVECGIAEQNMMSVASGLALSGKIPFVSNYAVFSPGINWSHVRVNVCQNDVNVKIGGAHAGISVGPDGMSHQALEDVAIMRCLPGMVVLAPCDSLETYKATVAAAERKGPVYLRFAREKTPIITSQKTPFRIGQAEIFKDGKDVSVIACGPLVYEALAAAKELKKQGIDTEVINNHTIKPMDVKTICKSIAKTGAAVTVEEHQVMGGMGSAVCEVLAKNCPVPVEMLGMQDTFGESGQPDELLEKYGMKAKDIVAAVKKVMKRK